MSAIEGFGRVEFPESPKTEMEVVHIPTSTGLVQDLHVIRELRGSKVHSEVIPPKKDLSRECAAALLALPPLERVQGMVESVSSKSITSVERSENRSRKFKSQFDVLESDKIFLQARLNRGEKGLGKEVAAFNQRVSEYNKTAGEFQQRFEAEFLDRADGGFYEQDVIQPKGIQSCPIGDRHLSFTAQDNRVKGKGPVFVFEAGIGSAGTFDGKPISEAMSKDSCCLVTYDRAGTGRSPSRSDVTEGSKLIDEVEEDFNRLISHLETQGITPPVVLVAHSLGAIYAQNYALKHPDKVAGLVLIDPASEGDKDLKADAAALRASSLKESESPLNSPKKFLAVEKNGALTRKKAGGITLLGPPTKEEGEKYAPKHMKSFSDTQRNTSWWMSAHQKQNDFFPREKEGFLSSAETLKHSIDHREKASTEIPLLVIEKKDEERDYSDWRQNTLTSRFGNGRYVQSQEPDHNLQFLASGFVAEQIRRDFF